MLEQPQNYLSIMNTVYYDPLVFPPDEIVSCCTCLNKQFRWQFPTLKVLTLTEKSSRFNFTYLVFAGEEELDLQRLLFMSNYDEVILGLLQAWGAQASDLDNIFNYNLTLQMLPFLSMVF